MHRLREARRGAPEYSRVLCAWLRVVRLPRRGLPYGVCFVALVAGTTEALQMRRARMFLGTTLALVSSQAPLAWCLAECPRVFQSTVRWAVRATASPREPALRGVLVVLGSRTAALREVACLSALLVDQQF